MNLQDLRHLEFLLTEYYTTLEGPLAIEKVKPCLMQIREQISLIESPDEEQEHINYVNNQIQKHYGKV